ncbi:unnamed protein product [marine sediment metagenome]|uniref:Potassium channel domain-containing protein n=1 Tax=marine sediment metagenome TaxID=412755 RepID=X1L2G5_9ZZZZ
MFAVSYVYYMVEGWSYLDSVYFTVVTFATIGYGDIAPVTNAGKILTIFASFFGIAMVFYLISVIGSYFFERKLRRLGVPMDSKIKPLFRLHKKKRKRK